MNQNELIIKNTTISSANYQLVPAPCSFRSVTTWTITTTIITMATVTLTTLTRTRTTSTTTTRTDIVCCPPRAWKLYRLSWGITGTTACDSSWRYGVIFILCMMMHELAWLEMTRDTRRRVWDKNVLFWTFI